MLFQNMSAEIMACLSTDPVFEAVIHDNQWQTNVGCQSLFLRTQTDSKLVNESLFRKVNSTISGLTCLVPLAKPDTTQEEVDAALDVSDVWRDVSVGSCLSCVLASWINDI